MLPDLGWPGLDRAHALAERALTSYDLGSAPTVSLLGVSENITYQVDDLAGGRRWALRLYRPGYHPLEEIISELAWIQALRHDGVIRTPPVVPSRDGELVTVIAYDPSVLGARSAGFGEPRYAALFEWVRGSSPHPSDAVGLLRGFSALGEITARLHQHARAWRPPAGFTRFAWTWRTTLGSQGRWGSWQDGIRIVANGDQNGLKVIDSDGIAVLTRAVEEIRRRIERFGTGPDRFGLVHADMRLANLLVNGRSEEPTVIDFDDCGFSWYLFDLAASLSFIEHRPEVGDLVEAWLASYRRHVPVSAEEESMIATFVLLRRLLLVAWLGSHPEADAVASVAEYATTSCDLADDYLSGSCSSLLRP
ncbi:aminoglycoside phosphotransferase [Candidatus Protofrankia datiscae]|uniref:Aminoglycoside phosphotransferase n=1 Tax=Candidatus Protofrankia datiscae TaxID=2716812 RepID=F8B2P2_9ACTN|nr:MULTISPECIES: phosphotransferase [Protofrankia]AEH07762.1 aminoglycoside phosphotransferase [Candidatus Protofrankia datiscae]